MRGATILFCAAVGCTSQSFNEDLLVLRNERIAMERDLRADQPLWIEDFNKVISDYDDHIPVDIYLHVVRKLHPMDPKEIDAGAATDVRIPDLIENPKEFRGRFIRLTGRILRVWPEEVGPGLPVPRVWGLLILSREREPFLAHVLEPPNMLEVQEDIVGVDGLFFKVLEYPLKSGGRMTAPFLLARRADKYD